MSNVSELADLAAKIRALPLGERLCLAGELVKLGGKDKIAASIVREALALLERGIENAEQLERIRR